MAKHAPERTCIGCRGLFHKDQVLRIVAGPEGALLDYREKLPGRAAYVCPKRECIEKALSKEGLPRALRAKTRVPSADEFIAQLLSNIKEKVRALILISAKAGKLAAGYSAVHDALQKGRGDLIIYAWDLSDGTREKLLQHGAGSLREATLFSRDEIGKLLNRELVGVLIIDDKGLANALWTEAERLKGLINHSE